MSTIKQRLAAGEMVRVLCAARLIHPVIFDVQGMVGGFHGVWIDQEHAAVSYDQIALACACCRANGMDAFVRMAMTGYAQATANLEAGASGLMAARIESAAHAEEFLQWVKFAPRGNRGMNSSGYDCAFGGKTLPQFSADANRDTFVAIQIETLGSLEEVDAIAALDGVDLVFVGPSDLSQVLGVLAQWDDPRLWQAMERVAAACRKHGKQWGTIAVNPAFAAKARELGCRLLSFGTDAILYRRGVEATKTAFAELFR